MAFKVQIVCIVISICLIDSLHSASLQRTKRSDKEDASTPAPAGHSDSNNAGLPDMNSLTQLGPQNLGINQANPMTNIVSQNINGGPANSIVPSNIKNCVPSGVPGSEGETTKEPEKSSSDGGDTTGSSHDGSNNPITKLDVTSWSDKMKKVVSEKDFTKLDFVKIPGSKQ